MTRSLLILLLALGICTNQGALRAQSPYHVSYTTSNGLPSNTVYDLLAAPDGNIYIGTDAGLVRHNGKHFQRLPFREARATSISYLCADQKNRVWGNNFSKEIFRLQNDTLEVYRFDENKLPGNLVNYQVLGDSLWVFTTGGFGIFDVESHSPLRLMTWREWLGDMLPTFVYMGFVATDGQICLFGPNVLFSGPPSHGKHMRQLPDWEGVEAECIRFDNDIYIVPVRTDKAAVLRFDKTEPSVWQYLTPPQDGKINSFHMTDKGTRIWAPNTLGLWSQNDRAQFFPGLRFSSIAQDFEGNYWLGTLEDGLLMVPSFQNRYLLKKGEYAHQVSTLIKMPEGPVVCGTTTGKLLVLHAKGSVDKTWPSGSTATVERLFAEGGKNIINTGRGYVDFQSGNLTDMQAWKEFHSIREAVHIVAHGVFAAFCYPEALGKKMPEWGKKKHEELLIWPGYRRIHLREARCRAIRYNPFDEHVYSAYSDKCCRYDWERLQETNLTLAGGADILGVDFAWHSGDTVWVATVNQGIVLIQNGRAIRQITDEQGLSNNALRRIYPGKGGCWALTQSGIDFIDGTGRVTNFAPRLGLPGGGINDFAVLGDTFWIATNENVLMAVDKSEAPGPKPKPLLRIAALWSEGKRVSLSENLVFAHNQNQLKIALSNVSFLQRSKYLLEYRIAGYSTRWYPLEDVTDFNLPLLPPGQYELFVRMAQRNHPEAVVSDSLRFQILPPWWRTYWFVALSTIAVGAGIMWFVRRRIRAVRRKYEAAAEKANLENRLKQSQLAAIRLQMKPHFIFNALNTIQYFIYQNQSQRANFFLGKFADLMRQILEMSDEKTIPLRQEISTLTLYLDLEKMRFADNLSYSISVAEDIDQDLIYLPPMLVQPYVENAIKHGLLHKKQDRTLQIECRLEGPNTLLVRVTDNGVGLRKSQELNRRNAPIHKSYALGANKKRLEILNENRPDKIGFRIWEKTDSEGRAEGTVVELTIPIF